MTKKLNFNKKKKITKNIIKKRFKRIKRFKYRIKIKKEKSKRFKKKLFCNKKIKNSIFLDEMNSFVETPSKKVNEINEFLLDYKNEFMKIIKNISSKFKINVNISELNIDNKINEIISQKNKTKMNIILDIDQTLVYSKRIDEKSYLNKIEDTDNHYIEFYLNNEKYLYFIQVRKGLNEFISKISPYCNFYINTMANPVYIKEVLTLLNKKYSLSLNDNGSNNVFITNYKDRKTLPPEITKGGYFLILDDNICSWDKSYLSNIIPVRKFYGIFNNISSKDSAYDTIYQYYFFTNKIYCYNEQKRKFYDLNNKLPFCSEASWSDINQLNFIAELIIKVYLLNKLINIPISYAFYNILHNILNDCRIFYDGEDKSFIQELIILLGGKNELNINNATYVLVKDNKSIFWNKIKNEDYNYINIKWLFDTYFSFLKHKEEKYKII